MSTGEDLHAAVCQAVALLNAAPEVARSAEGREARNILRQALVDYANAYMDAPVTEVEREAEALQSNEQKPWTEKESAKLVALQKESAQEKSVQPADERQA